MLCAYELHRRTRDAPEAPRVVAFDPGLMPGTGLARDYGPAARFLWRYALPLLTAVAPNVNRVATSAGRLVALVEEEARASGEYVSRGKTARSSEASYEARRARDLWEVSSELAGLS